MAKILKKLHHDDAFGWTISMYLEMLAKVFEETSNDCKS